MITFILASPCVFPESSNRDYVGDHPAWVARQRVAFCEDESWALLGIEYLKEWRQHLYHQPEHHPAGEWVPW